MILPNKFNDGSESQEFRKTCELIQSAKIITLDKCEKNQRDVIDVRFYCPPENTEEELPSVYGIIWIKDYLNNNYCWATACNKGGGYHLESAVLSEAFKKLGINFEKNEDFSCVGDSAMYGALEKLAANLGYNNVYLSVVKAG